MSSSTASPESKWLTMAMPVVVTLLGLAVQWGTLGADVRNLERRVATSETQLSQVNAAQSNAREEVAVVKAELARDREDVRRELERLARAVEKLTDPPRASR